MQAFDVTLLNRTSNNSDSTNMSKADNIHNNLQQYQTYSPLLLLTLASALASDVPAVMFEAGSASLHCCTGQCALASERFTSQDKKA